MRFAAAGLLLAISLLVAASTVAAAATISVTVSDGSTSVDESGDNNSECTDNPDGHHQLKQSNHHS